MLGIWVILAPVCYGCSCTARGTTQSSSGWFTKSSCEICSWFPNQLFACSPHLTVACPRSSCPLPKMMNGILLTTKKKKTQEREDQEVSSELKWIFRHYSWPCFSFLALEILGPCSVITSYDWERVLVHRDPPAQLPGFLQKRLLLLCDFFSCRKRCLSIQQKMYRPGNVLQYSFQTE